jgi:hypothetical protein
MRANYNGHSVTDSVRTLHGHAIADAYAQPDAFADTEPDSLRTLCVSTADGSGRGIRGRGCR